MERRLREDGTTSHQTATVTERLRDGALLLTAAHLPFETESLSVAVGGWTVTTFELVAALTLFAHTIELIAAKAKKRPPVAVLLMLALAAAGLFAVTNAPDVHRGVALKAALRWLVISGLFWAGVRACRRVAFAARLQQLLAVVGVVVASLGLAEVGPLADVVEPLLTHFRPKASIVEGARRLTSTFPHANVAAAFLAMVLPLLATIPSDAKWSKRIARGVALVIVTAALTWTQSRGGLVAGLIGLVAVAAYRFQPRALASSALALLTAAPIILTSPPLTARWAPELSGPAYAAEATVPAEVRGPPRGVVKIPVTLRNTGYLTWRSGTTDPIHVGYTRAYIGGKDIGFDDRPPNYRLMGERPLPHDVAPGETVKVVLEARTVERIDPIPSWVSVRLHHVGFRLIRVNSNPPRTAVGAHGGPPTPDVDELTCYDTYWDGSEKEQFGTDCLNSRFNFNPTTTRTRPATRTELWAAARILNERAPLTGIGLDTFRFAKYDVIATGSIERDDRVHANNAYYAWLVGGGYIGLLLFVAFLVSLAHSARESRRDVAAKPWITGGICAVIAFSAHGMVDAPLFFYSTGVAFALVASLVVSARDWSVSR